jgi:hypothetical protein
MVRRSCLVIGVGVVGSAPLGVLFMLTLLTVYIVSNWFISRPLKKMAGVQITAEILMGTFLLLLQMTIINATTFDNQLWMALAYITFFLALSAVVLLMVLTVS